MLRTNGKEYPITIFNTDVTWTTAICWDNFAMFHLFFRIFYYLKHLDSRQDFTQKKGRGFYFRDWDSYHSMMRWGHDNVKILFPLISPALVTLYHKTIRYLEKLKEYYPVTPSCSMSFLRQGDDVRTRILRLQQPSIQDQSVTDRLRQLLTKNAMISVPRCVQSKP